MPSDPNQPAAKPTVAIPREDILGAQLKQVLDGQAAIKDQLASHRVEVTAHLDKQDNTLGALRDGASVASARLQKIEIRLDNHDGLFVDFRARMDSNSMRAKATSIHDDDQDLKITKFEQAILDIETMTKQQNKLFGIDPKTLIEWARGPNAKRDVATIMILIASIATSVKEIFHR